MFKLIATSANSDCTYNYNVKLDKPYTVGELINEILSTQPNHYGSVKICWWHFSDATSLKHQCEYSKGKIVNDPFPDNILAKQVIEVRAYGGWSYMSYSIRVPKYDD